MKDMLKMTRKERASYMDTVDIEEELDKVVDYKIYLRRHEALNIYPMVNQIHKLLFGHNRQPGNINEKYNYLMVHLVVLYIIGEYYNFIGESESK